MAVVVLGKRLERREIHESLQQQVDLGIRTLRDTDAEHLILTGGRTNPSVPRAESEAMRTYASEQGVEATTIRTETTSRDTIGNAFFARILVDELPDVDTVRVVTTCYHAERAAYVFEQCFGPAYDIRTPYCYETGVPKAERSEAEALERTEAFFDPVTPGELAQLAARIDENHDLYGDRIVESVADSAETNDGPVRDRKAGGCPLPNQFSGRSTEDGA